MFFIKKFLFKVLFIILMLFLLDALIISPFDSTEQLIAKELSYIRQYFSSEDNFKLNYFYTLLDKLDLYIKQNSKISILFNYPFIKNFVYLIIIKSFAFIVIYYQQLLILIIIACKSAAHFKHTSVNRHISIHFQKLIIQKSIVLLSIIIYILILQSKFAILNILIVLQILLIVLLSARFIYSLGFRAL